MARLVREDCTDLGIRLDIGTGDYFPSFALDCMKVTELTRSEFARLS